VSLVGVYHITYAPGPREVYLYFEAECNLSCWGCIAKFHPIAFRLKEEFFHIIFFCEYKGCDRGFIQEIYRGVRFTASPF